MTKLIAAAYAALAVVLAAPAHADPTPPPPSPAPDPSPCHNLFPPGFQLPPPYHIERCPGT